MPGNRIEFTINANQSKSENLQFDAQGVIVDNPNSYYIYFQYLKRWVPPFTIGAVLRYGVQPAIAAFQTDLLPPGVVPLSPVQDTGARLIFIEELISESAGSPSPQVTTAVQSVNIANVPLPTAETQIPLPIVETSPGGYVGPKRLQLVSFALVLAAGVPQVIIVGAAGQNIYLWKGVIQFAGAAGGFAGLEDSIVGNFNLLGMIVPANTGPSTSLDFMGEFVQSIASVQARSIQNSFCAGHLLYQFF